MCLLNDCLNCLIFELIFNKYIAEFYNIFIIYSEAKCGHVDLYFEVNGKTAPVA